MDKLAFIFRLFEGYLQGWPLQIESWDERMAGAGKVNTSAAGMGSEERTAMEKKTVLFSLEDFPLEQPWDGTL